MMPMERGPSKRWLSPPTENSPSIGMRILVEYIARLRPRGRQTTLGDATLGPQEKRKRPENRRSGQREPRTTVSCIDPAS